MVENKNNFGTSNPKGGPTNQFDRIGRFKPKILKNKIFFKSLICETHYLNLPKINQSVVNFNLLLKNRDPSKILCLTGDHMTLVLSMDQGFCGLPITKFTKWAQEDILLPLMESYVKKLKFTVDPKSKNNHDFGCLLQKPKKRKKSYRRSSLVLFSEN